MTDPILPPYDAPFLPVPQVTPLTYRDGVTMLKKLEYLKRYINLILVPFVNENYEALAEAVEEQVNLLIIAVNEAIDSVINDSVDVQDSVVAGIFNDENSDTRAVTDVLYAAKSVVDTLVDLINTGRLSEANLNSAFVNSSEVIDANHGGTGISAITPFRLLLSGTDADGPFAFHSAGTAGQFLKSGGPGANPTWDDVYTKNESYSKTESDYNFISDYSPSLKNKTLYTLGDSQGTTDGGNTKTFGGIFNERNGGTLNNQNVSSSFWRDVAQRLIGTANLKNSDDIVLMACGINGPARYPLETATRQAEYQACKAAILMCGIAQRIEHTSATFVGTWVDYVLTNKLSNSTGKSADTGTGTAIGSTATWALGGYGNYFAIGYSFRAGLGVNGRTGDWTVGATNKLADNALAPSASALELVSSPQSAGNLVPQVADFPGINAQSIVATYRGSGVMIADAVFKLMDKPPMIGLILPTYCKAGGSLAVANDAVDRYRGDIRNAIAEICSKYPNFRGRVFAIDPHEYGFNVDTDLMPDGLHWNDAGQALVEKAAEHSYSRTIAARAAMESYGIAGFNWSMF